MRDIRDIFKRSIFRLNLILLFFSALFLLPSCSGLLDKNESYNIGFKAGYEKGYSDGKATLKDTSHKTVPSTADPNLNPSAKKDVNETVSDPSIPQKAIQVLDFIRKNNRAPEGYVGGRTFGNYEQHLPQRDPTGKRIEYREWDIHPKEEGKSRGAQRIVTGSDGSAWYTSDHYQSFTEIE